MSHGAFVEAGHHRGRDPPEGEMHRSLAVSLCLRGPGFEDGMAAEVFGARGLYHRWVTRGMRGGLEGRGLRRRSSPFCRM